MNALNPCSKALQSLEVFLDESGSFQQVLGRIPDQGKLGEDGHGATGPPGRLCGGQNETGVVREVPDDWIDLAESDFHRSFNIEH
jgi:hypothetical protein